MHFTSCDENKTNPVASVEDTPRENQNPGAWKIFRKHALLGASILLVQSGIVTLFALLITKHHERDPAIRRLTRRLITASEDERRHIARELHDDIGQRLSLISVQLSSLQDQGAMEAKYEADLADLLREVNLLITDVHSLSHSLHSAKLEHLGLESALGELCSSVSRRHGVDVALRVEAVPSGLASVVALCFYRVAQEALSNVVKHSHSSRALITVAVRRDTLSMQVRDFGIGFDSTVASSGLGLATMEERLLAISGRFSIVSAPQHGTTITAEAQIRRRRYESEREQPAS